MIILRLFTFRTGQTWIVSFFCCNWLYYTFYTFPCCCGLNIVLLNIKKKEKKTEEASRMRKQTEKWKSYDTALGIKIKYSKWKGLETLYSLLPVYCLNVLNHLSLPYDINRINLIVLFVWKITWKQDPGRECLNCQLKISPFSSFGFPGICWTHCQNQHQQWVGSSWCFPLKV